MTAKQSSGFVIKKRYFVYMALCLIALYVLIPKIDSLRQSLPLVRHASLPYVLLAIISAGLSYVAAAGVYVALAIKPLAYSRTLFMQVAGMFANRLLPAGIGGLGINFLYLRKAKHSKLQATTVVAANNTVGLAGHFALTASLLLLLPVKLPEQHVHISNSVRLVGVLIACVLIALLILFPGKARSVGKSMRRFFAQLALYRKRPARLVTALACSLSLTFANVTCLWLSILAVHLSIGFIPVLLVFTFGLIVGTATPTPGSLGGIEAGLAAGLVAYHIPLANAVGAVLLYRLISYWLPLFIGSFAFITAKRRNYF
jgi:uncharacterized protein (TIRG00374 family)